MAPFCAVVYADLAIKSALLIRGAIMPSGVPVALGLPLISKVAIGSLFPMPICASA